MSRVAQQKVASQIVTLADGRMLSISEQPLPDGGWLATLEDVTEQHAAEQQRAAARANDARRSTVESTISDSATISKKCSQPVSITTTALKETAVTLLESSDQAAQHAQSAVGTSNAASTNVATAATAADELSGSIGEISRQLVSRHRRGAPRGRRSRRDQ